MIKTVFVRKNKLRDILSEENPARRRHYLQLWFREGVPRLFENHPDLYCEARELFAQRTGFSAEDLTIIGSARTGYSFKKSRWLKKFNDHSDLDFTLVSPDAFDALRQDHANWLAAWGSGRLSPRSGEEQKFWQANRVVNARNIFRGFIDPNKLPDFPQTCPMKHKLNRAMFRVSKFLAASELKLEKSEVTLRVYRDWFSFRNQNALNLQSLRQSFANGAPPARSFARDAGQLLADGFRFLKLAIKSAFL